MQALKVAIQSNAEASVKNKSIVLTVIKNLFSHLQEAEIYAGISWNYYGLKWLLSFLVFQVAVSYVQFMDTSICFVDNAEVWEFECLVLNSAIAQFMHNVIQSFSERCFRKPGRS